MINLKFYTALGKLLYAISKADGEVQQQEEKVVEKFINEEIWHHHTYFNEHPEAKEIILAKLSFFNANKVKLSAKQAFDSYKKFFKNYGNRLDSHQKELASSLVCRVAASYKGINKEELKFVDELIALKMI